MTVRVSQAVASKVAFTKSVLLSVIFGVPVTRAVMEPVPSALKASPPLTVVTPADSETVGAVTPFSVTSCPGTGREAPFLMMASMLNLTRWLVWMKTLVWAVSS